MGKIPRIIIGFVFLIAGIYFFGPKPEFPDLDPGIPVLSLSLNEVEEYVATSESEFQIKEGNESRIIWADSIRKTPYAIVYLHGFSASPREGDPVHYEIAKRFGCNLYVPRIVGHGIEDRESFASLTPKDLINSAKEAIAIGRLLGDKIILMSCSTGGTYSVYLAAHDPDLAEALILYSPNFEIYDPNARLLTGPWGRQMGKMIVGDYYVSGTKFPDYWTSVYRTEGLIALQGLLDQTMTGDIFHKIELPYFVGFYYRNEEQQDQVISIEAIANFYAKTNTPDDKKRSVAFPEAGNHVITSDLYSSAIDDVIEETASFLTEVIGMEEK